MKAIVFAGLALVLLTGCIKNDEKLFTATEVEWDASTWNTNASTAFPFPVLTRVPVFDAATPTTQPLITRTTDSVRLRVNLVGPQRSADVQFTYRTDSSAVAGTHFTALSGTGTIPANSSFGYVTVRILNPGATTTGPRILVLQLLDNGDLKANVNYAKLGLSIAQN